MSGLREACAAGDEEGGDACDDTVLAVNVVGVSDEATCVFEEEEEETGGEEQEQEKQQEAREESAVNPLFDLSRFKFAAACAGPV